MLDYLWILLLALLAAVFLLKRRGQISLEEAKAELGKGAVVLDVRSPQEFAGGSLPGAVNIPLNGISRAVAQRFPDKGTVLLCHCASGTRSAAAVSQLRAAGYPNAHNLGGYGRAAKVVS